MGHHAQCPGGAGIRGSRLHLRQDPLWPLCHLYPDLRGDVLFWRRQWHPPPLPPPSSSRPSSHSATSALPTSTLSWTLWASRPGSLSASGSSASPSSDTSIRSGRG